MRAAQPAKTALFAGGKAPGLRANFFAPINKYRPGHGYAYFRCGKVHAMTVHKNQPFHHRFRFALMGLAAAWRSERNFRIQLGVFLSVVAVLIVLGIEPVWWALVLLTSGSVLAAELFNTALEHLADHLHPDTHAQIQIVKDCAAAAVLLAASAAIMVGIALIFHLAQRYNL
jgi:diacylglycerol kinase (ATP)